MDAAHITLRQRAEVPEWIPDFATDWEPVRNEGIKSKSGIRFGALAITPHLYWRTLSTWTWDARRDHASDADVAPRRASTNKPICCYRGMGQAQACRTI